MRKNTDLEKVKDFAKLLLRLDIEPSGIFPVQAYVSHPLYESSMQYIDDELVDISKDRETLKRVEQNYRQRIDERNDAVSVLMLITKPYRLFFVCNCKRYLNQYDFSKMLIYAWTLSEGPNSDINVKLYQSVCMFRKADKNVIMDKESFDLYQKLPEIVHIYRGVSENLKNKDGLSWTLDLDQAKWFANRFDNGIVYEGDINKEYIFAYLNNTEQEIICNYKKIENMKIYE